MTGGLFYGWNEFGIPPAPNNGGVGLGKTAPSSLAPPLLGAGGIFPCGLLVVVQTMQMTLRRNHCVVAVGAILAADDGVLSRHAVSIDTEVRRVFARAILDIFCPFARGLADIFAGFSHGVLDGLTKLFQRVALMLFRQCAAIRSLGQNGRAAQDSGEKRGGSDAEAQERSAHHKPFAQIGSPLGPPAAIGGEGCINWSSKTRGGCGCGQANA
jgi:hypothetical protein